MLHPPPQVESHCVVPFQKGGGAFKDVQTVVREVKYEHARKAEPRNEEWLRDAPLKARCLSCTSFELHV